VTKRALISVSDKDGVVDFSRALTTHGFEIISTGGTARLLKENNILVTEISEITEFPEIMDGRIKTLHPKVFGGLLAVRDNKSHMQQMQENGIGPIDLVCVNLYPFESTIAKKDVTFDEAIENIDIGGPSLIRAAAKNHRDVAVVVHKEQYQQVLDELKENNKLSLGLKKELAREAFNRTAEYDAVISSYLNQSQNKGSTFPSNYSLNLYKVQDLRYGENKHQKAVFYKDPIQKGATIANAEQLHGKELSYNNILDINGAIDVISSYEEPVLTILKHVNPCGVAARESMAEAFDACMECDPTSPFGGIVAMNRTCDLSVSKKMAEMFLEVVLAPEFDDDALDHLKQKKNIRLLKLNGDLKPSSEDFIVKVRGGLLVQTANDIVIPPELKVVTDREPTDKEMKDLLFAWKVVKNVKSNAIVYAKNEATVGVGAGQMSRVDSAFIAGHKSNKGSVMASDAFFPFRDGIDTAAEAGVTAVIHPGGSIRDQEIIQAANEHGMAMVFTGVRAFKH